MVCNAAGGDTCRGVLCNERGTPAKEGINLLFGDAAVMAAQQEAYIHLMQDQLLYGQTLIAFLKKEYGLE